MEQIFREFEGQEKIILLWKNDIIPLKKCNSTWKYSKEAIINTLGISIAYQQI